MLGFDFVFGAALFKHVRTELAALPHGAGGDGKPFVFELSQALDQVHAPDSESANTSAGADGWPVGVVCHVQPLSTRSRLLTAIGSFSVIPIFDAPPGEPSSVKKSALIWV